MELLGLISAPVSIIAFITRPQDESGFSNIDRRLIAAYGKIPALIIKFGLPETFESLIDVDKVARGSDLTALAFKNSYVFDCSMTIVAGSIIAQVAITALSLQYLSLAHWVARAFFIASLIAAAFSVYSAVILQRKIGRLYEAQDIKNWISAIDDSSTQKGNFRNMTSTLLAAQMLAAPSAMVNISLGSFLTGLAVYLYFIWVRKLDRDAGLHDSRDVFITFVICVSLFFGFYTIPVGVKVSWDRAMEMLHPPAINPQNPSQTPKSIVSNQQESSSLISALEAAATAHARSAEADRLVATEYARILASANSKPVNSQSANSQPANPQPTEA